MPSAGSKNMKSSVFFDTQIIINVASGTIKPDVWSGLLRSMRAKYKYRVSFTTLIELLNALAGGDEAHFRENQKRFVILTGLSGCEILPLPGEFVRSAVLGLPLIREEFSPATIEKWWIPIITRARSKQELSSGKVAVGDYDGGVDFGLVRKQMDEGKDLWLKELGLAKQNQKQMPSPALYAEFMLHFFVHGATTTENIGKMVRALDACYCHLAGIHHDITRSLYRYQDRPQDWIDNQQLMYLADPSCVFVTLDRPLIARLKKSSQRARVQEFSEFCNEFLQRE